MLDDTIAAIATPLGEGGLAVVRLSGPQALNVADKCFTPAGSKSLNPSAAESHTIHFGRIVFAPEGPQGLTHHFAGIRIAPGTHFPIDEILKVFCKCDFHGHANLILQMKRSRSVTLLLQF